MRGFKAFAFAATASVLLAGSLQAQAATGQVKWIGVNGAWGSYRNVPTGRDTVWNVYTSPYFAQFKIPSNSPASDLLPPSGTNSFGQTVDIFCVDFSNYANTGTYGANFTNLGSGDLSKTRGKTFEQYMQAAFLIQKIPLSNAVQVGNLNGAIWQIMSGQPLFYNNGGWDRGGIDRYVAEATNLRDRNWESVNAAHWVVVTDVASAGKATGGSQEYLTQVTPEPATMLLLGTGLVVMLMAAGALRRPVA
jgi:hypothetical protein